MNKQTDKNTSNIFNNPSLEELMVLTVIDDMPAAKKVGIAVAILAAVAKDNADNPVMQDAGYVHTACNVANAINFLTTTVSHHIQTCDKARQQGEIEA